MSDVSDAVIKAIEQWIPITRKYAVGYQELLSNVHDFLYFGYEQDKLPGESFENYLQRMRSMFDGSEVED